MSDIEGGVLSWKCVHRGFELWWIAFGNNAIKQRIKKAKIAPLISLDIMIKFPMYLMKKKGIYC